MAKSRHKFRLHYHVRNFKIKDMLLVIHLRIS